MFVAYCQNDLSCWQSSALTTLKGTRHFNKRTERDPEWNPEELRLLYSWIILLLIPLSVLLPTLLLVLLLLYLLHGSIHSYLALHCNCAKTFYSHILFIRGLCKVLWIVWLLKSGIEIKLPYLVVPLLQFVLLLRFYCILMYVMYPD